MTVSFYIGSHYSTEQQFEHSFERTAELNIVKEMWTKCRTARTHFAVIFNVHEPPADMIILSSQGLGVADIKSHGGIISGFENSTWEFHKVDSSYGVVTSGSHLNPFVQVSRYRAKIHNDMPYFANRHARKFPNWLLDRDFYDQGAVFFSDPSVDFSQVALSDSAAKPWFELHKLRDVAEWAHSLVFGNQYRLTTEQIEHLVKDFFHAKPYKDIEGYLDTSQPFGYLWLDTEQELPLAYPLRLPETFVGRSARQCSVVLDSQQYPYVSRKHAQIKRTAAGVYLLNCDNSSGTWVNGERVGSRKQRQLRPDDKITFGAKESTCTLIYRLNSPEEIKTMEDVPSQKHSDFQID